MEREKRTHVCLEDFLNREFFIVLLAAGSVAFNTVALIMNW